MNACLVNTVFLPSDYSGGFFIGVKKNVILVSMGFMQVARGINNLILKIRIDILGVLWYFLFKSILLKNI